jgi:hypothetical protein
MRVLFAAIVVLSLNACVGCGPGRLGVYVSQDPPSVEAPDLPQGGSMTLQCGVGRTGGRFTQPYRGEVKVRVETDEGIEAAPTEWEGVLTVENNFGMTVKVTVRAMANAPLGRHVLQVIAEKADGSTVSRDFEFKVIPPSQRDEGAKERPKKA